jgi:IPT/TIG domain
VEKTERIIAAIRLFCALLAVVLLIGAAPAYAETSFGGTIVADTTWSAAQGPYLITSDVSIESGAVLTVEAGVTVRFQSARRLTVQSGGLRIDGTAAAPVLFTSAGNTPGGTPAAGDWAGLQFLDGAVDAGTIISYLTVSYGSTTFIYGASPTFSNCSFDSNSGYALTIDLASFPHGSGNSAAGNGVNAIKVPAGVMTASGAWDLTGIPYFLEGAVYVGLAPTLSGMTPGIVEQAAAIDATIIGTRLNGATQVVFSDPAVSAVIQAGGTATSLPVRVSASASAPLGALGITVSTPAGDVSLPSVLQVAPPVPVIASVTPNRLYINRPATAVTIAGQNFTAESVVYLDGTALATAFVSQSSLTATVPGQPLAHSAQLQVKNPDPRSAGSYIVSNTTPITVELPQFVFSPASATLRQGETGSLNLTIPFAAPAGGLTVNLASTNTATATVPATATIPEGATAISVTVIAPDTVNTHDVVLEVHANQNNWSGNKATVTVRPEPTANLSPGTLLAGQGFTFFLSVNLTDPAPVGGLVVTLTATPAGVVTLPASVTVPAGATQAQVTVSNTGTGTTTISGAPATGFTAGDTCTVTVRPVQTTNVTPLVSPLVGVRVATTPPANSTNVTYTPLLSRPVGIVYGPIISGLAPDRAPFGSQNLLVRVNGSGFATDSSVAISPALSGVTLRSDPLVVAPDGSYVEFRVDIAADAQVMDRIVTVTSNGKTVPAATADANRFKVTWPAPQLWSLVINNAVVNTSMTLQLSGRFFQGATTIAFEPPQGVLIGTPITVSADGTTATVPVYIAPDAAPGTRAVWITAPGGSTSQLQQTGNVFRILTLADPGTTYMPVVSSAVGVTVQTPTPTNSHDVTYTPLSSRVVGVSLGPVLTSVAPISGAIGTTDLRLRVNGYGLSGVDSFTIEPNTGLSITRPDPPLAPDGSWAEALVSIAADAPLTQRVVVLKQGAVVIPAATAEANRFRVTLPVPEMTSIFPTRSKAGTTLTLTVNGRLLTGATAISFVPPGGITVTGLTVASDGTSAQATVIIAANAPVGQRVVTITTPGGTTSATPGINTFEVIDVAVPESTYAALISRAVGVSIPVAPSPASHDVSYGAIVSGAVGVFIPVAPPATQHDVTYTPIVARPVGVAVGTVMSAMTPTAIVPGTTRTLTFRGTALGAVNSLDISPGTGLTIGTFSASPDGSILSVDVTAAADAPRAPRVAVLKTATGTVPALLPGSNHLYVGARPEITSIFPSLRSAGDVAFTLTVNGNYLDSATTVRFEPPDGITVLNPPVINASGNIATVTVIIDGMAAGGQRIVVIEGPYGSSVSVSGSNNTFTVYRPVALAPAPARRLAGVRPTERAAVPLAGASDTSRLTALLLGAPDTIPVVRKPLQCRTTKSVTLPRPERLSNIRSSDVEDFLRPTAQFLSMIGWGYRAPPG